MICYGHNSCNRSGRIKWKKLPSSTLPSHAVSWENFLTLTRMLKVQRKITKWKRACKTSPSFKAKIITLGEKPLGQRSCFTVLYGWQAWFLPTEWASCEEPRSARSAFLSYVHIVSWELNVQILIVLLQPLFAAIKKDKMNHTSIFVFYICLRKTTFYRASERRSYLY